MENAYPELEFYSLLSRREMQILQLIIEGSTDKDIALKLGISYNTVRTHHQNILSKTKQHNIRSLIYYAKVNRLILH